MTGRPDAATYFGGRTSAYDSGYDALNADGHALRARLDAAVRLLGDGPGDVLDVGMGPGRLCAALDQRGWTVSGVDASEEMVTAARLRVPAAAARLVRGEIEALPFADESFDRVAATGVLEYADLPRALAEVARVLRGGGLAVVSYPNPRALYGIWKTRVWYAAVRVAKRLLRGSEQWLPRGGTTVPPGRFSALLVDAGLEIVAVEHTSYLALPSPLDALLPRATERLGRRLEGSGPRTARLLATQVVYAARKRPAT